jgi:acyl-coenzyme A synthetase/AMP-(fatty) acid ligase
MNANIVERVYEHARARPAAPAIVTADGVLTYGQLQNAVLAVARHLRQQGICAGQLVGVSFGHNPLHLIAILALAHVGAVSLPLHIAISPERRALAARRFGAVAVVSGRDDMALPGLPFISLAHLAFDQSAPREEPFVATVDAPFRLAISSGTSSDPKGMVLTHGMMGLRMVEQVDPGFSLHSRVVPMDLNFIIGFKPAMGALCGGATIVLPRSAAAKHLAEVLVSHVVTHILLSPAQAQGLCDALPVQDVHCPHLVCFRVTGGPMGRGLLQELRQKVTPHVYCIYGSTESGTISIASPEVLDRHPESAGHLYPWVQIEVVDENDAPVGVGSVGNLRVRSRHQVSAYVHDVLRNQQCFRDGWFYSGDRGRLDAHGHLFLVGRADEQLNIGGYKINPQDIEETVCLYSGATEAGAFSLSDSQGHESLAVALKMDASDWPEDFVDKVRNELGPLAPARYFSVKALPRTLTGKLRRSELSEFCLGRE